MIIIIILVIKCNGITIIISRCSAVAPERLRDLGYREYRNNNYK